MCGSHQIRLRVRSEKGSAGIINLQSVLIDGMPRHVKDHRPAWNCRKGTDDLPTSDGELEIDSQIFDAPPAAVEMDNGNTEDEVLPPRSDNNEVKVPLVRRCRRKQLPLHVDAVISRSEGPST